MPLDTVRLRFPVTDLKSANFLLLEGHKLGELTFKIFKDTITVGSFSYELNIFVSSENRCTIEFSVPKFHNGHNLDDNNTDINALVRALLAIRLELDHYFTSPIIQQWEIMRVDESFYIDSSNPFEDMAFFQNLSMVRKKRYVYDTSVMFVGASYSTKLYIKESEFLKHDFNKIAKRNINLAHQLLKKSKNKIRIESSYRIQSLRRITKYKKLTVERLIKTYKKIINYNKKQVKQILRFQQPTKMKKLSLLKILQLAYPKKKAIDLFQFYQLWTSSPLNRQLIKESYSRWTINRKLYKIEQAFNLNN